MYQTDHINLTRSILCAQQQTVAEIESSDGHSKSCNRHEKSQLEDLFEIN
jgi:hypothetical protein